MLHATEEGARELWRRRVRSQNVRMQSNILHAEIHKALMQQTQEMIYRVRCEIHNRCMERVPWWKKLLRTLACMSDVDFNEAINEERAKIVNSDDFARIIKMCGAIHIMRACGTNEDNR